MARKKGQGSEGNLFWVLGPFFVTVWCAWQDFVSPGKRRAINLGGKNFFFYFLF